MGNILNHPRILQFVQIYRRDALEGIDIQGRDVFVPAEIIIKLYDGGKKLIQEEAVFHPRKGGEAKYGKAKYFIATLVDQLRFFLKLRLVKRRDT